MTQLQLQQDRGPKYCMNDGTNPDMWVCDVDWEANEDMFDPRYVGEGIPDCPDGGSHPCKISQFNLAACDLLTGWFTRAREFCIVAQKEYDDWYDYDYLELSIMPWD